MQLNPATVLDRFAPLELGHFLHGTPGSELTTSLEELGVEPDVILDECPVK